MRQKQLVSKVLAITALFALLLFCVSAFAQETTGGVQGTVKDTSGAVVSGATVEVSGAALIGVKTATTDSGGYYHFANLPPGTYDVTVKAKSFGETKQTGLQLVVGVTPTVNFTMKAGAATETVEVSSEAEQIDVTSSKDQSNVTKQIINGIPKGRSYQSVITFAPGARLEPLQDAAGFGYQIDGASATENTYLVEGQDTTAVVHGRGDTNVPFEFIKEVQIKSSGFEAEYGGALGGVVNVIQQRGSNQWHGSVYSYYSADAFNAKPVQQLRLDPATTLVGRIPETPQFYQRNKDHFRVVEPGFEFGGPVFKDRLWVFAGFNPQFSDTRRPINFNCIAAACGAQVTGIRNLNQDVTTYNAFGRLDGQIANRFRLFFSYQNQYQRVSGASLPTADSAFGQRNTAIGTSTSPDQFNYGIGSVSPNVIYNAGADITISPSLVATTRWGYFYTDFQQRGLPTGVRDLQLFTTSASPQGLAGTCTPIPPATAIPGGCDRNGVPLPANLLNIGAGTANIGANEPQLFDKTHRRSFSQDLAYFKKTSFGTHNFKLGYSINNIGENINQSFTDSLVRVAAGASKYSPVTQTGQVNCAAIVAASGANYGTASGSNCEGRYGYFVVRQGVETHGLVGSNNQAIYFQDAWTVGHGLTINAGVRFDKENLPSFSAGNPGINFDFTDKFAPRIGAAYDLFQNGKVKIYGSYGKFFDIMKYELPQGSFGGQYWHDCVYAMDDPNFTGVIPTRDASGNYCGTGGASTKANGTIPVANRFIENNDLRIPSNDVNNNAIVPGLKPMQQHEMVFGVDWAINPNYTLETRYSRKRLDRTIEDIGALQPGGEQFFIGNPGFGAIADQSGICPTCAPQPKASRRYDGVEFRLTRRASERWFGTISYTYSRLYGNYSGLSSTDEAGRSDPNVSRAFDEPQYQFDSHGQYIDGPEATDRPHTFKAFGYYRLKWWGMETLLGATQYLYSGTPITTSLISAGGTPQLVENRGNFANVTIDANGVWTLNGVAPMRTPTFSQTDFNFVHEIKVSKTNEALRVGLEANITNILNQKNILNYDTALLRSGSVCPGTCGTPNYDALMHSGYNYVSIANAQGSVLSGTYGQPNLFQNGRAMRFKFRFTF